MDMEPANREDTGRNEDGTFKPGISGNPAGRPKGTMKDYLRRVFMEMTDEEKRDWVTSNKIPGVDQIKLAEGNPHQSTDTEVRGGLTITFDGSFNKDANILPEEQAKVTQESKG